MRLTHSQYTQIERKWRHIRDPGSWLLVNRAYKNGNQTKNYGGALKQTKIAVLVYLNGEISYSIVSIFLFSSNLCCVTHLEQIQFTFFHLLHFPLNDNSSYTTGAIFTKLHRNVPWVTLYKNSYKEFDPSKKNMAARGHGLAC